MQLVFHIGYHKTASTCLQSLFAAHGEIYLANDTERPWHDPFLKELIGTHSGAFSESRCERQIQAAIGNAKIENRKVVIFSAERLSGHPISGGIDSEMIAERIHRVAPGCKVVCLVREQLSMIGSVYKQMVVEGYQGSLTQLLNEEHWKIPGFDKAFYRYDRLVNFYGSLFAPDRMMVVPCESIREDRAGFLSRLFSFIGVASFSDGQVNLIVNPSLPHGAVSTIRVLNYFRRTELNRYPLIPLPALFHRTMIRILGELPDNPKPIEKHSRWSYENIIRGQIASSNYCWV